MRCRRREPGDRGEGEEAAVPEAAHSRAVHGQCEAQRHGRHRRAHEGRREAERRRLVMFCV